MTVSAGEAILRQAGGRPLIGSQQAPLPLQPARPQRPRRPSRSLCLSRGWGSAGPPQGPSGIWVHLPPGSILVAGSHGAVGPSERKSHASRRTRVAPPTSLPPHHSRLLISRVAAESAAAPEMRGSAEPLARRRGGERLPSSGEPAELVPLSSQRSSALWRPLRARSALREQEGLSSRAARASPRRPSSRGGASSQAAKFRRGLGRSKGVPVVCLGKVSRVTTGTGGDPDIVQARRGGGLPLPPRDSSPPLPPQRARSRNTQTGSFNSLVYWIPARSFTVYCSCFFF